MKTRLLLAALAAALPLAAHGEILTFDDLGEVPGGLLLPQAYHGFDNVNFYYVTGSDLPATGFEAGVVSSSNDAFNGYGADAVLTSATLFTLNDAWFTKGFTATSVTVTGRTSIGGVAAFTKTFATGDTPALQTFNWTGLAELDFSGGGLHFAVDDIRVNEAVSSVVPEPAAWALMITGFGMAGATLRRRRATA